PRDPSRPPLLQAVLNLQTGSALPATPAAGVALAPLDDEGTRPAKFELTLDAHDGADGLTLRLEYRRALFAAPRMAGLLDAIGLVLDALMTGEPTQRVADLPALPVDELRQMREMSQGTGGHAAAG